MLQIGGRGGGEIIGETLIKTKVLDKKLGAIESPIQLLLAVPTGL